MTTRDDLAAARMRAEWCREMAARSTPSMRTPTQEEWHILARDFDRLAARLEETERTVKLGRKPEGGVQEIAWLVAQGVIIGLTWMAFVGALLLLTWWMERP